MTIITHEFRIPSDCFTNFDPENDKTPENEDDNGKTNHLMMDLLSKIVIFQSAMLVC